jgi:threonine aldolase
MKNIFLASDNTSPAHPNIIEYILKANQHHASSYGNDEWTQSASKLLAEVFKKTCKVLFVPTGTGANILSLKLMLKSHTSVICSDIAHIAVNETGAPEAVVGCKLLLIKSHHGKISAEDVLKVLKKERFSGKHATYPKVVSITQPTEVGTLYTLNELQALRELCSKESLFLNIDACRIYNAAAHMHVKLHEIIDAAKPDIISLGGTKNGLAFAEAVVIFNEDLYEGSDYLQKQTLQLLSKMRYLSAQYIPFFKDDLWHHLASHANKKAQEIVSILKSIPQITINHPVETNQIFFSIPPTWIPLIQKTISCYVWDESINEIRFIASWNTSDEDVSTVRSCFENIAKACKD